MRETTELAREKKLSIAKWLEHWTFNEKDQSSSLELRPNSPVPGTVGLDLTIGLSINSCLH